MRPVKKFEEYLKTDVVRIQSVDKSRAESLKKESLQTEKVLISIINSVGLTNENANTIITIAYDIIMKNIRSKMILSGYNSSGRGAHEAEVSYLRVLGFNEKDVQFCDQLRYFRNGIMYYGKIFDKKYAEKTIDFLKNKVSYKKLFQ